MDGRRFLASLATRNSFGRFATESLSAEESRRGTSARPKISRTSSWSWSGDSIRSWGQEIQAYCYDLSARIKSGQSRSKRNSRVEVQGTSGTSASFRCVPMRVEQTAGIQPRRTPRMRSHSASGTNIRSASTMGDWNCASMEKCRMLRKGAKSSQARLGCSPRERTSSFAESDCATFHNPTLSWFIRALVQPCRCAKSCMNCASAWLAEIDIALYIDARIPPASR